MNVAAEKMPTSRDRGHLALLHNIYNSRSTVRGFWNCGGMVVWWYDAHIAR